MPMRTRKQCDLEPTPVERKLVNAIAAHRWEWPFIYVEIKAVAKEDLLDDAAYCARHKHPSLTNFLKECGDISGLHRSMLYKIKRAGIFYEARQREFKDDVDLKLPKITDELVVSTSAESFILMDRLRDKMLETKEFEHAREKQEAIVKILLVEILCEKPFPRKRFDDWFTKLNAAALTQDEGQAQAVIDEILFSLVSSNDLNDLPQTKSSFGEFLPSKVMTKTLTLTDLNNG